MIIIAGILVGAFWGVVTARRRDGSRLDQAQYGAVFAIIGGILGMFGTVAIERMF